MKKKPMKYDENAKVLELTRRNLTILLAKLDDPLSAAAIFNGQIYVKAVEDEEHYADREPGIIYMPSLGEFI
jgi:hypothetical protein